MMVVAMGNDGKLYYNVLDLPTPLAAPGNNTFDVTVSATNAGGSDIQSFIVTVNAAP